MGAPLNDKYILQLGDSDQKQIWGGIKRSTAGTPVADLQRALLTAGFALVSDVWKKDPPAPGQPDTRITGVFDRWTRAAVVEFQIYAKMPMAGKLATAGDSTTLRSAPKDGADILPPGTPITGMADTVTQDLLKKWNNNGWVCPVMMYAYRGKRGSGNLVASNIWRPSHLSEGRLSIWSRDVSGLYEAESGVSGGAKIPLGRDLKDENSLSSNKPARRRSKTKETIGGGPWGVKNMCWSEAEMTPDHFFGLDWVELQTKRPARAPTFLVLRAVAEVEARSQMDDVNGTDDRILSAFPFQLTLIADRPRPTPKPKELTADAGVEGGELGGILAEIKAQEPEIFRRRFGEAGLDVKNDNTTKGQHTAQFFAEWQPNDGEMPSTRAEWQTFRTWHWYYRLAQLCRLHPETRAIFWNLALSRLKALMSWKCTNWGPTVTFADVLKSEAGVAALLRLHVKEPGRIMVVGKNDMKQRAGPWVTKAAAKLKLDKTPPSNWTITDEGEFIGALAKASGKTDLIKMINDATYRKLSTDRTKPFKADYSSF